MPENKFEDDVNDLILNFELGYFAKQPPLPQFRAIGNDEGLFVIVPEGRIWFSTKDVKAGVFPMTVMFGEDGREWKLDGGY